MKRKKLKSIANEVAELVYKKNLAYGDSFLKSREILKILYPNGIPIEKYNDLLTIVRIIDKLFRICSNKKAFNEDPFSDILGYSLLALTYERNEKK